MIKKIYYWIVILPFLGLAQNTDTQLRINSSVDYKINKKWKVELDYRYSLEKDISSFQSSNLEFSAAYKYNKHIAFDAGYRFSTSFERDNHRFFASILYDYKWKRFTFNSRTRYQYTTRRFDSAFLDDFPPNVFLRQKLSVDYNVPKSKLNFNLGAEFFWKTGESNFDYNRIRYSAGTTYSLKYGNTIGLSTFYENRIDSRKTDRIVWTLKYNLSLDELLKKLKKEKGKAKKSN